LIRLGLAGRPTGVVLRRGAPSAWFIPHNEATILLDMPAESVRQRFRELIREGRLQLGQSYSVASRDSSFVLFPRLWYTNTYRPIVILRLSPQGTTTRTAMRLTFVSPGVLLVLAWPLAVAAFARFTHWGAIGGMALVALGVHISCCILCLREQRDTVDDLTGVVADALLVE
jgi:hypothetical protein